MGPATLLQVQIHHLAKLRADVEDLIIGGIEDHYIVQKVFGQCYEYTFDIHLCEVLSNASNFFKTEHCIITS